MNIVTLCETHIAGLVFSWCLYFLKGIIFSSALIALISATCCRVHRLLVVYFMPLYDAGG